MNKWACEWMDKRWMYNTCISSMVWTIKVSCRSSMAPSIQLLKGAALLANSRYSWSIVSNSFSVLWKKRQSQDTHVSALHLKHKITVCQSSKKQYCPFLQVRIERINSMGVYEKSVLPARPRCVSELKPPVNPTDHRSADSEHLHWESHSTPTH